MAVHGRPHDDDATHAIAGNDQLGLRWDYILLAAGGPQPVHVAPGAAINVVPAPDGHAEPMLTAPIDSDSAPVDDIASQARNAVPQPETTAAAEATGDDADRHSLYSTIAPLHETPSSATPAPGDPAPPAGLIPRAEAVIWSGPAIMVFPGDSHDSTGDSAQSGASGTSDLTSSTEAGSAGDTAGTPNAITRDDLDPILAAMGSGPDHAVPPGSGGSDLSAAFLPPGSSDLAHLGHGLDPGFALTPQPLPPPPDVIG